MEQECKVQMEGREDRQEKRVFYTKTNVALLVFTLFLVGSAAAVLLVGNGTKAGKQQDGHFEELRHSLRQTNIRAAIHLEGKYNHTTRSVVWQQDTDQAYVQGDLKLENNEVVIPHKGPYFVYSQASYRLNCDAETLKHHRHNLHLSHMVERWSDSYGDVGEREYRSILHSVRTVCERHPEAGHWFSGIYVGAMFKLNGGDRLRTNLTNDPRLLSQLEDGQGETFFGVFAL